jgi:hypothetical protein
VVLARYFESTRDSQQAAAEQVTSTVETIKREAWTGADSAAAYDQIKRLVASCETRVRTAHARLTMLQSSGEDLFDQWAREIREYQDGDLRQSARQSRSKVLAEFNDAMGKMRSADGATEPALGALRDQVLFIKHHRDTPTLPPRPEGAADPAVPAKTLADKTEVAAKAAGEFAASARGSEK